MTLVGRGDFQGEIVRGLHFLEDAEARGLAAGESSRGSEDLPGRADLRAGRSAGPNRAALSPSLAPRA